MKFILSFKDSSLRDGIDFKRDATEDDKTTALDLLQETIPDLEYGCIEIDTEAKTIKLIKA